MQKFIKLTLLCSLSLLIAVNSSNAAFPKDKKVAVETVANPPATLNEVTEVQPTKADLKNELKKLDKENNHRYSGGGSKSKVVAALLAFFLGGLGIHSFYMGQKKKGFIQLGLTAVGIALYVAGIGSFVSGAGEALPVTLLIGYILILGVSIWAFIDFIRILTGGLAPEEGFDN